MSNDKSVKAQQTGVVASDASSKPQYRPPAPLAKILGSSYAAALFPRIMTEAEIAEREITANTGLSRAQAGLGIDLAASFACVASDGRNTGYSGGERFV